LVRNILAIFATLGALVAALTVLVLGLPFWLVGALTHSLAPRLSPRAIRWTELFEFDATLGWRAKPNLDCHCLEERSDVFHIATDFHGWPGKSSLADSQLVVLGDSHAFGYGVDHEAAFFSLLNGDVHTKPIAVPGYNLVHQVLLMERLAPQLRGKLVVLFIYIGNDLHENLLPEMSGYRTPCVRRTESGTWEIVTHHLSPAKWDVSRGSQPRDHFAILDALYNDTHLAERAYSACEFLLKKAHTISRKALFPLVIMSVPVPWALADPNGEALTHKRRHYPALVDHPDIPDRKIGLICQDLDLPFVSLQAVLTRSDYWERDDHWTKGGHRKVAVALLDVYRKHATPVCQAHTGTPLTPRSAGTPSTPNGRRRPS
jgi:hypothetical protein